MSLQSKRETEMRKQVFDFALDKQEHHDRAGTELRVQSGTFNPTTSNQERIRDGETNTESQESTIELTWLCLEEKSRMMFLQQLLATLLSSRALTYHSGVSGLSF